MGRYYNGDIEGKFMFGVQSSDDADFFGACGSEPSYISYYFDEDNLTEIENGLKECKERLGKNDIGEKIKKYFDKNDFYNDKTMAKELGVTELELRTGLEWYARERLGKQIYECVKENGECSFEAEL